MSTELIITIGLLVLEVLILVFCRIQLKKPANPAKPRMLPYGVIMLFLMLGFLVTAAHTISLVTGHQLMPRNKNGGGMSGAPSPF